MTKKWGCLASFLSSSPHVLASWCADVVDDIGKYFFARHTAVLYRVLDGISMFWCSVMAGLFIWRVL